MSTLVPLSIRSLSLRFVPLGLLVVILSIASDSLADVPKASAVVSIEVTPRALTLDGPRDARRVLVEGRRADGLGSS